MIRNIVAGPVVLLLLGGCALWPGTTEPAVMAATTPPVVRIADMPGVLEPIHAAAFTGDLALFRVSSNGCTDKADVLPVVNRYEDEATITLRRTHDDTCDDPVEDGVELIWSFEELGLPPGTPVEVNNPYLMDQDHAAIATPVP